MAKKIRGMTIEIGADTSKFNEAMAKTYKQLNKLDEAMKKINSLLKKAPNDKDLYLSLIHI